MPAPTLAAMTSLQVVRFSEHQIPLLRVVIILLC